MGVSRLKIMKASERKPLVSGNGANLAKAEANGPVSANGQATGASAKAAENDLFNKHYNKELKVSEGKFFNVPRIAI